MRATIQKRQHIVEKGLSLPSPRPGFGRETIQLLSAELSIYLDRFGCDELALACVGALESYHSFNQATGASSPLDNGVLAKLKRKVLSGSERVGVGADCRHFGGVDSVNATDTARMIGQSFDALAKSRRSIRNFRPGAVDESVIVSATVVAQSTPSVCNRQGWRVHCYQGQDACRPLLDIQTGNRGFSDTISTLLVVTCRLSAFISADERNEAYVDGGMFAMTLVHALHSRGVSSCCLNLCLNARDDHRFHQMGEIPESEVLVMAIAIGYSPDSLSVAKSMRRPVLEVLEFHSGVCAPSGR